MRKIMLIILILAFATLAFSEELNESFFYGKWQSRMIGEIMSGTKPAQISVHETPLPPSVYEFQENNIGFFTMLFGGEKFSFLWRYSPEEKFIHITWATGSPLSLTIFKIGENKILTITELFREILAISLMERAEE